MTDEPRRHVVVFDCNIYLDVARIVGPPFSWQKFDKIAARLSRESFPHPDRANDSLRAVAVCSSGRFAGGELLEVWTNAHIDKIVRGKAADPRRVAPSSDRRGLGWSGEDAQSLVDVLITDTIARSSGGTLGSGNYPDGNPPLDYEDGMVYGACRKISSDDPLCHVYCVTRDKGFLQAGAEGRLTGHSRVITPSAFVGLVRSARQAHSVAAMRPR
ncbi:MULTISPECIES: hypothetical protein [Actinosynnema]|uniref:hypothetical protein n=1 Tax=Actinosynnema TaxID=40566 RepID=UPI0020A502CF|nr:hypothetical protein [Actinosynnema pretiosum]